MTATRDELKKEFAGKAATLKSELEAWFEDEVEAIDSAVAEEAPSGTGGSIIGMQPAIDSKRVLDATAITKKVLGIDLPPEIIKAGGYASCAEMIADIVPKLEKVFTGELKVRKPKPVEAPEPAKIPEPV
ncbi:MULTISPECIES: hypothetical protein [unclassified Caulobacter]|uniref:hypothetical protein n=1 Tax=unclassified Caulobacter TaxID=2648921 RepID=UPI0012E34D6F|nr:MULTISPECIES: hypothetical protein [unclassified Caulobacter]